MADKKPIFALDLSNEGIALWHRKGASSWIALGQVALSDPEFELRLIELRDKAPVRGRTAVIRIPRSEVMLTRIRLGVFEGDAAASHARKQIDGLTPYSIDEVAYDLGDKGAGNTAPVAVIARKTLNEAEEFARSHGFDPIYFTTQYAAAEFPREPRFYTEEPRPARAVMGWIVPWVAAAAIGLTAGFLGYSWLSGPTTAVTTALDRPEAPATAIVETPAPQQVTEAKPAEVENAVEDTEVAVVDPQALDANSLSDVAPKLPPVTRDLVTLREGTYPDLLTTPADRRDPLLAPEQLRLASLTAQVPQVAIASNAEKTNELAIVEARRDLPDVKVNDEIVSLLQDQMIVAGLNPPPADEAVTLASLTSPNTPASDALLLSLDATGESKAQVSERVTALPDPPPPPKSLVTAEPGTLTPTPEGTLGPGNILIFSGPPPNPPRARPGSEIEPPAPDPLAGFKPRLRPDGLVSPETVEEFAPKPALDGLLAQADETLRESRPTLRPNGLVSPETVAAFAPEEPLDGLLALADPELKDARPTLRPDDLATTAIVAEAPEPQVTTEDPVATEEQPTAEAPQIATAPETPFEGATQSPTDTALAAADTAPNVDEAPVAPNVTETPEKTPSQVAEADDTAETPIEEAATAETTDAAAVETAEAAAPETAEVVADIVALADPALADKTPRTRPSGLAVPTGNQPDGLLAEADPTLKGFTPRLRPGDLNVPEDARPAAADAAETPPVDVSDDAGNLLLAAADPTLADKRATLRPNTLEVPQSVVQSTNVDAINEALAEAAGTPQDDATTQPGSDTGAQLLALADPTLSDKRAKVRPTALATDLEPQRLGLLALADPSLRGERARARPGNLKVFRTEPEPAPEPEPEVAQEPEQPTNTIASATRLAIAKSPEPRLRPNKIKRVATRVIKRQQQADDTSVAAGGGTTRATARTPKAARGTAKAPPGPTAKSVARAATERSKFRKSRISLVGVFGTASSRRALVRLPTGRYVKVKAGDRVSGWKVSAIGEASLRIQKGSRNQTLRVP